MTIVHVSDTHGAKYHTKLNIPECDVLIHSGDVGGRVQTFELVEFLHWFEQQPAKVKIYVAGNHDLCLDKNWAARQKQKGSIEGLLAQQAYMDAIQLLEKYNIKVLNNKEYVYEGVKFYGSPYSPSFNRENWAFNADRGQEIQKQWGRIPSDVNVLITHTPMYGILDSIEEKYALQQEGDRHRGCQDLYNVMVKRLFNLKLHCCGHIHDNYGVITQAISGTRHVTFSNGAVLTNEGKQLVTTPLIITM